MDDNLVAEFEALGVSVDLPPDERKEESDVFLVWESNWPALTAFLALETQWRVVSRGMTGVLQYLGLDYPAADVVLRRRRAKSAVFDDLLVMERAALKAFGEIEESEAGR